METLKPLPIVNYNSKFNLFVEIVDTIINPNKPIIFLGQLDQKQASLITELNRKESHIGKDKKRAEKATKYSVVVQRST